jgi:glucan phosphoethanolaminetransferase (alkaline phosphatase superfamily)
MKKNKKWLWLLLGIILFGNISILIWCNYNKAEWLTLISGWISGIATLGIGVIAVLQNKKYSDANNETQKMVLLLQERMATPFLNIRSGTEIKAYYHSMTGNIYKKTLLNQ